jgi:ATP-dependent DNA helicase RecQ
MALGDGMNVTREFNLDEFCRNFKHFPIQANSALQILTRAGYIEYTDEQDNASRIHFLLQRHELYKLRALQPFQEELVQCLLRNYGGVFSDYVYIDERRLATLTNSTADRVYHELINFAKNGFIHYIPHKRTPYITFCCKRIEKERIVLSDDVYKHRKEEFEKRIESMLFYADEKDFCRSKVLLQYFGEEDADHCKVCDVCRAKKKEDSNKPVGIESLIMQLLEDCKPHSFDEFSFPGFSRDEIGIILRRLIDEEIILVINGQLQLKEKPLCPGRS